jgi:hypothetical protein
MKCCQILGDDSCSPFILLFIAWIWIPDMKNDDHPMAMQEHCSLGSGLADFSLVKL